MKKRHKAVSPVVATVLLIAVVVVIALIVFLWLRGLVKESGEKFGKNIELVCEEVVFSADYFPSDGMISVSNDGNVPIKNFLIKKIKPGDTNTEKTSLDGGLPKGQARNIEIEITDEEKLLIVPILESNSNSGRVEFICDDAYGIEINLV